MKKPLSFILILAMLLTALGFTLTAAADSIVDKDYAIKYYVGESNFSVFLDENNAVYTSGKNTSGQLGRGTKDDNTWIIPKKVLDNVQTLDTGKTLFTIALGQNKSVYAWGSNKFGQLGQGTGVNADANSNYVAIPALVDVAGNPEIIDVKAGATHSILLTAEGDVYTFGSNLVGQLGLNMPTNNKTAVGTPTKIDGAYFENKKIVQIATCEYTSFALSEDGFVYAWGENDYRLLASDNEDTRHYAAVPEKTNLTDIVKIDAESTTAMALGGDGAVKVWGNNNFAQYGIAGFEEDYGAVQTITDYFDAAGVKEEIEVKDIMCGGITNFILSRAGDIYSFGSGGTGQVGFDIQSAQYKNHPLIKMSNVIAPLKVTFYQPLSIYDITVNGIKEYEGKLPVDLTKKIDVKVETLVNSIGNRTFILDDSGNSWSFGDNTAGLASSGDVNNCLVPVRATLYRNANYDKEVKQKNYLIVPITVLSVIAAIAVAGIIYAEVKNHKLKKANKQEKENKI